MDYSKLSDKALEQIASGKGLDYSKLDDSDLEAIVAHGQKPGMLESAGRGAAQGFSLGLADEIAGGLKHPIEGLKQAGDSLGLTKHATEETAHYRQERDSYRGADKAAQEANPIAYGGGNVAGSLATALVPGMGIAKGAGALEAASNLGLQGLVHGAGSSDSEDSGDLAKSALMGVAAGGVGGAVGSQLGKLAGSAGKALSSKAEQLAENATGATRLQAEKFAPGAGRQLLDRGVVKALSTPKSIAARAAQQMESSQNGISSALEGLDSAGGKVPKEEILNSLKGQLEDLMADPSKAPVARKLRSMIQDIESESVSDSITLSAAEQMKRNYQGMSNYTKPNTTEASKRVASTFRQSVEDKATAANPELASQFKADKQTYGLMAPIQEAAEKRALQQNQHPILGLNDVAAVGAGLAAGGGPLGGLAASVGRRVVSQHLPSTLAVGADKLGTILQGNGIKALGNTSKLLNTGAARALEAAAPKGKDAVNTTHFLLMQSDPSYRRAIQGADDNGTDGNTP